MVDDSDDDGDYDGDDDGDDDGDGDNNIIATTITALLPFEQWYLNDHSICSPQQPHP